MTRGWQLSSSDDLAMLFFYNQGFVVDIFRKRLNPEEVKRGVYYHANAEMMVVYDGEKSIVLGDRQLVGSPANYILELIGMAASQLEMLLLDLFTRILPGERVGYGVLEPLARTAIIQMDVVSGKTPDHICRILLRGGEKRNTLSRVTNMCIHWADFIPFFIDSSYVKSVEWPTLPTALTGSSDPVVYTEANRLSLSINEEEHQWQMKAALCSANSPTPSDLWRMLVYTLRLEKHVKLLTHLGS